MTARRPPDDDARTAVFDRGAAPGSPDREAAPAAQRSEPIRVVSMKAAERAAPRRAAPNPRPEIVIRALSEVTPIPGAELPDLGRLAPPRDPRRARARRFRELALLVAGVLAISGGVALAIWLLARS